MENDYQDLPQHALERLHQLRSSGNANGVFTSDLSVNEFLLVRDAGFEPIGLVVGTSIYHIGYQRQRWGQNQELDKLTQAMYHARELAMSRMEEEARALGADGVVGVRLKINRYEWGEHNAEFIAIGTAVAARDKSHIWRRANGLPFTSDLSGQDFWTLLKAGYRPLSLAMGTCVYHVAHQGMFLALSNIVQNKELPQFTQALYEARELAMERMQQEAHEEKAEGIVGVTIEEATHHGWDIHVIEFFAVGTAVTSFKQNHEIETPQMVLSLDD